VLPIGVQIRAGKRTTLRPHLGAGPWAVLVSKTAVTGREVRRDQTSPASRLRKAKACDPTYGNGNFARHHLEI
jgi:hypothetical protein